jgi:hypothetical protein
MYFSNPGSVGAFLAADLSEARRDSGVGRLDRRRGLAPALLAGVRNSSRFISGSNARNN